MSRCLVTGHKGYIGGHVYNVLKSLGHEVVGIDTEDEFSGNIQEIFSNTHPKRHINHQGIANRHSPEFYKQFQPEYIFHLACLPRVGYSVEHPVETMQNNVLATSVPAISAARELSSQVLQRLSAMAADQRILTVYIKKFLS
jgi:CDP-glucose 4,6-dehydratase